MALSILDGNQTAVTLATTVSGSQHYPNHIIASGTVTANLGLNELPYIKANISITKTAGASLVTNVFMRRIDQYKYQSISGWAGGEDEAYIEIQLKASGEDQFYWQADFFGGLAGFTGNFAFAMPQNKGNSTGDAFPPTTWAPSNGFTGTMTVSYEQPSTQLISGTVTIGSIPNGTLTTRFGSITTADTAFSTTAVTNTSRKYLMIQNIASTVITVGIGFTPTTTQGIQLSAGALVTYDGNYIPTGAVRILSSVTSSNFTLLEA
jgi:hypothetical protein